MKPKHQAASGFNSCLADILYLVFKLLSPAELRVLCLVNKNFRTIAEPFLYSKIQWTWPQLAAYITNIHFDSKTFSAGLFQLTIPEIPISSTELDEPITFIWGTRVPYSDLWIQELRQGTTDAFVALLLAQLSNLRCLYLGPVFTQQSALIGMVLRSAICEPVDYRLPDFQHLQDVSFLLRISEDRARDKKVKNTADILPFFYIPSVQHMSASIENLVAFMWPAAHLPVPSNLTSLDLTSVQEAYLGELLSVTQNLKTLHWAWYYDFGVDDQFTTPIIDLDQIAAAISHVQGTLTDLTISANCDIGGNEQFLPGIKTEGLLHAMVNCNMLKRLQVPWPFLVGFAQDTMKQLQDVISRNIEFLAITDELRLQNDDLTDQNGWPLWEWEDYAILGLIQLWLKDWKACMPHLCGISLLLECIIDDRGYDEWCPSMRHQLRELGAQAGVQLEIIDLTGET